MLLHINIFMNMTISKIKIVNSMEILKHIIVCIYRLKTIPLINAYFHPFFTNGTGQKGSRYYLSAAL
jgi:hypothetical protein